jgi:hypothetical protein
VEVGTPCAFEAAERVVVVVSILLYLIGRVVDDGAGSAVDVLRGGDLRGWRLVDAGDAALHTGII